MAKAITADRVKVEGRSGSAWTSEAMTTFWRGLLILGGVFVGLRIYQQVFAWSYGLDSTHPGFAQYWLSLFGFELLAIVVAAAIWYPRLMRKCHVCEMQRASAGQVDARHEAGHVLTLWSLLALLNLVLFFEASYFAEQDATWHQVVVRDTALTPSHIVLFYGAFPAGVLLAVGTYLYARTHLPEIFRKRGVPLSFILIIGGTVLEVFQVAFNEWGHSFWIMEEIFSAPFHWPFVFFAYMLAGIFAVWFQTVPTLVYGHRASRQAVEGAPAGGR